MELPFLTINDVDLTDRTVLMRIDINSPIDPDTGEILSAKRLEEHVDSIKRLPPCRLILLAHQSRPGKKDYTCLGEHARILSRLLDRDVLHVDDLFGRHALEAIENLEIGQIILLENTRFFAEEVVLKDADMETQMDTHIVRNLSNIADYYIIDAFSAIHRSQPTLVGFWEAVPCIAGPLMKRELEALSKVTSDPERPCIAILGGLKVDDSIRVAENLFRKGIIDRLLTTGVVGTMFQWAGGHEIGKPNVKFIKQELEKWDSLKRKCKKMLKEFRDRIEYPIDMALNANGKRERVILGEDKIEHPVHDIGINTIAKYSNIISEAKTIVANGPAGVYELPPFDEGTLEVFRSVNNSGAYSVMGGGETNRVIRSLKLTKIDHISTGGGALINYLSGAEMPVLAALKRSREKFLSRLEDPADE